MPRKKDPDKKTRGPSGMGSVSQRADGLWWSRITLENGKRKAYYGHSESEVKAKLKQALIDQQKGTLITERIPTLAEFIPRWLEDVCKPKLKASTHSRYTLLFNKHILPALGKTKLDKLTPQLIQRLYNAKLAEGLAPSHVDHIHRGLHVALETAVRWGYVQRNVCDLVDAPRVPRMEYQIFKPDEARRFLVALEGSPLEAYFIMALTTGMRAGELRALKWTDIDFDTGTVTVHRSLRRVHKIGWVESEPKTRSGWRTIPLIQPAIDALRVHRVKQNELRLSTGPLWTDNNRVFTTSKGTPMEDSAISQRYLLPVLQAAGLPPMRNHDLRHSMASILKAFGIDLLVISNLLGHANLSITADIYTHVFDETTREAVNRLNTLFKSSK